MAVSYVGVTSGNSVASTSTSFVTTLPTGWAAGDVAILSGHVRGTSLTMSTPAGWTLLPGPTWPVDQSTNSRLYAWYRVLQAGDTAPTITNSGAMTGGWSMTAYRGGNTSSPIGQVGTSSVSGTSLALPTLTGVLAGSALAVAVHAGVSTGTIPTNITPNAAYTEVADHATSRVTTAANQRMEAAYRLIASAGSYGGEAFTTTVTSSMIALLAEVVAAPSSAGSVAPDGLSVPVSLGSPDLAWTGTAAPDGISVPVASGDPAAAGSGGVAPDGVSVPVALGSPILAWSGGVAPDGLAVLAGLGAPTVAWSGAVSPDGAPVPVALGSPTVGAPPATVAPDGVAVVVALGAPALTWSGVAAPDGVAVPVALGAPSHAWSAVVAPDGIAVAVVAGSPVVAAVGPVVARPFTGTTARPAVGTTARSSTGTTAAPDSGTTARPLAGVTTRP